MRTRLLAGAWLVLGLLIWNALFDVYVSRGAREYLQLQAEHQLGRGPEPSMSGVMAEARRMGATAATTWAMVVVLSGWTTLWMGRRRAGLG
jgi:hypothetical protein